MLKYKTKGNGKRGFTLVELVIVIAVIAVLAAVLIPTFTNIIESANNSADQQLVANMNTVLSTNIDADKTATAENLRKILKDGGYDADDLVTNNKDVAIVYNKAAKKFMRLNVKDTLKQTKKIVYMEGELQSVESVCDLEAYSVEEIFTGNIIVSTGGNEFAEALYQLHNQSADFDISDILPKLSSNNDVMAVLAGIINSTAYVVNDDSAAQISKFQTMVYSDSSNGTGVIINRYSVQKRGDSWVDESENESDCLPPLRVIFDENISTLDLAIFEGDTYSTATVILPNTIEFVTYRAGSSNLGGTNSRLLFAGNTSVLSDLIEKGIIESDRVFGGDVEAAKEGIVSLKEQFTREIFYVVENNANVNNFEYTKVSQAILAAQTSAAYAHKERKVVITYNLTISEDTTIPQNVTLSIPYVYFNFENTGGKYYTGKGIGYSKDDSSLMAQHGIYYFKAETSIVDDELATKDGVSNPNYQITNHGYKQFNVTLAEGKNLIIKDGGKLEVGGVSSYNAQCYQGHTSGYYGQLVNNGTITVKDGGTISSFGYIKGTGTITAENGADVYEPFIVADYAGGSNSANLYFGGQSPFLRYAMINIQCQLTINYGAKLWAHCNLWASNMYNTTDQIVIGYDLNEPGVDNSKNFGLITLEIENSSVTCTYNPNKTLYVEDSGYNNLAGDIGKTTVTIKGRARTESLSLLSMVNTANVLFPVPFNFDFIVKGNFTVKNHYVLLPGSSVTVAQNATLTVKSGSSFYVMDYLIQDVVGTGMSGKTYPTAQNLQQNDYSTSAELTVNGTFVVENNAKVGGIVRTDGTQGAKLDIRNADVSGKFNIGGVGMYDVNTSSYECPLRIYDGAIDALNNGDVQQKAIAAGYIGENGVYKAVLAAKNTIYTAAQNSSNKTLTDEITVKYIVEDKSSGSITYSGISQMYAERSEEVEISVTTGAFIQDNGAAGDQASDFNTHYTDAQNANSFAKYAKVYVEYNNLSLLAKSMVSNDISALAQNIKDTFTSEYNYSGRDVLTNTVTARDALNAYQAADPLVQSLLAETYRDLTKEDGLLNGPNRVLFTVEYTDRTNIADDPKVLVVTANQDTTFVNTWGQYVSAEHPVKFTLYSNITVDGVKDGALTLAENQTATVDLNGFTLTFKFTDMRVAGSSSWDDHQHGFNVNSGATLTIQNGSILCKCENAVSSARYGYSIISAGTLNISNVSVYSDISTPTSGGISWGKMYRSAILVIGGESTFTNLNIPESYYGIHAIGATTITLTNCNIVASESAIRVNQGENFSGKLYTSFDSNTGALTITVTGSTLSTYTSGASTIAVYRGAANATLNMTISNSTIYACTYGINTHFVGGNLKFVATNAVNLTLSKVKVLVDATQVTSNTACGLNLANTTCTLKDCLIAVTNYDNKTAIAVNMVNESETKNTLNLIYTNGDYVRDEMGNYTEQTIGNFFAVSSRNSVFVGDSTNTVIIKSSAEDTSGTPFNLEQHLTSAQELYLGYGCYMLQKAA